MPSRVNLNGDRDPDALAKDREEARIAAVIAELLSDQYDDLLDEMTPENPNPPRDWWDKWQLALMAALAVTLLDLSHVAAESAVARYGIGVDWDAVLQASQNWASQYGYDLVRGINATSQASLQGLLSKYYSGAVDYDTLTSMLAGQYGPTRAASIAASEVTRGFEQGIGIYKQELLRLGIGADRTWLTVAGACPLCLPLHGTLESSGAWIYGPPPGPHPRCQCYSEIVVLPGDKHYHEFQKARVHV